ncbi:unnamed protein product [Adineta steineri]|uniref:Protein kinase domain-containing protein n=1 Tax=Adineta steineri TaxID=433720 RepID=A0A813TZG5_9BILA|nr:unnamed protein product [Adineta steineri]
MPSISKRMEQDLAYLKIRHFHKLNLLSRGQFATTYKCTVEPNEVLCYKQYKIQHNDAAAISKVLEQLVPLMHINHENLIKYRGIALEYDHILFFMEYCSHGTIAQLLLGTSPSLSSSTSSATHKDGRRPSTSLVCSLNDTSSVDKGIIQTTAGFAFFEESLVQLSKNIHSFAEKTFMSSGDLAHFRNIFQLIHDGRLEDIPLFAQEAVNQGLAALVEKLYDSGFMD